MLDRFQKRKTGWIVVLVLLALLLIAVIAIGSSTIKTVTVTGNSFYTEDEIKTFLFDSTVENNTIKCYLDNHFGKNKEIPFIERYQIEIVDRHKVKVIVYEKNIIGYVYYMGSYMYFDRDGTVVESSSSKLEGICEVQGINFSQIVLHKTLETEQKSVFNQVLMMTQLFEKYELKIERISFDSATSVSAYAGDVKIELGEPDNMDLKIAELDASLPELEGLKGTLYLDNIQSGASSDGTYYFKQEQ